MRHNARRRRCSTRRRNGAGVDGCEGRCQPCAVDFRYLGKQQEKKNENIDME
jgi:hypothetical protein